jgi:predicted DNA binding CopG/RHH family protein
MKKTTGAMRPTKEQAKQLAALDAIRDEDIDLSDIPEQGARTDWVRGLMYRPVMRAISIRLPAPDLALARQLALCKGLPYQTYIKRLLHDALDRERVSGLR